MNNVKHLVTLVYPQLACCISLKASRWACVYLFSCQVPISYQLTSVQNKINQLVQLSHRVMCVLNLCKYFKRSCVYFLQRTDEVEVCL